MNMIRTNPAEAVPLPRVEREEIHPLTPAQVTAFLNAAKKDPWYPLYILAIDTGARQGELLALEWSDWFPATREIWFHRTLVELQGRLYVREQKTRSSRRKVVVDEGTADVLKAVQSGNPLLFPSRTGGYMSGSNIQDRNFFPTLKRAGLPQIRFHDLRHTCATLLLAAGVPVQVVAARLGHSNPAITLKTYAHVLPGQQGQAAEEIGRYLNGRLGEGQDNLSPSLPQAGPSQAPAQSNGSKLAVIQDRPSTPSP